MKKISNKGFTLIELLATILIIGLVLGITTYGIISSVNKAKEKSTILSLTSVKEAARIYSGELGEDRWQNGQENTYFCVTIEELINKGLLNKNAKSVENGGEINNYVVVVKNKTTKVIEKEELTKMIQGAMDLLTEKERQVVLLYYYEDMSLKEISSVLSVSESRVSQLHTKSLAKLKKNLGSYMNILTD